MRDQRKDDVVLLGEYARAVGISRMTAYVRARAGEIPVKLRGGRYEMTRHQFERLIKNTRSPEHAA